MGLGIGRRCKHPRHGLANGYDRVIEQGGQSRFGVHGLIV